MLSSAVLRRAAIASLHRAATCEQLRRAHWWKRSERRRQELAERAKWLFAEAGLLALLWRAYLVVRTPAGAAVVASTFGLGGYHYSLDDGSMPSPPLEPKPLPQSAAEAEGSIPLPRAWRHRDFTDVRCHRVDISSDESLRRALEDELNAAAHGSCLADGAAVFIVASVERVENLALWKAYMHGKREMTDAHHAHQIRVKALAPPAKVSLSCLDDDHVPLEPSLNECRLFHGTTAPTPRRPRSCRSSTLTSGSPPWAAASAPAST